MMLQSRCFTSTTLCPPVPSSAIRSSYIALPSHSAKLLDPFNYAYSPATFAPCKTEALQLSFGLSFGALRTSVSTASLTVTKPHSFGQASASRMTTAIASSPPMAGKSTPPYSRSPVDCLMPPIRNVPQFTSAAFANTTFHIGTPPRRDVHTNLFQFGFGKPTLPDIVQAGDPVLHETAAEVPVQDIGSPAIEKVINDMVAVMRTAPGVGLAAPQIGVALKDTKELMSYSSPEEVEQQQRRPFDLLVLINPKLETMGTRTARFFEGCLSVDGYRAMVERHLEVEVSALGRDGKPLTVHASGWQARILQHECDHLEGTLYVDRMVKRTFRTKDNLRLPLARCCPSVGVCSEQEARGADAEVGEEEEEHEAMLASP
eukprot:jgi/Mesen1/1884/ME000143S00936